LLAVSQFPICSKDLYNQDSGLSGEQPLKVMGKAW
jgi:hypothetical protein